MRLFILLFIFVFFTNCGKPKTVLICGDHVCVNKSEADQYFQENLTIEVKIIDKNKKKEVNLIELNLNKDQKGNKQISLLSKENTNKKLKTLSNQEIKKIKKKIKNKKKDDKIVKKKFEADTKSKIKSYENKRNKDVIDVCKILKKKCNIEEISKYLLEQGMKKDFPDITTRQ